MTFEDTLEGPTDEELARLLEEIERYLAAVDAFRALGAEPTWTADEALPEWWLAEHLPTGDPERVEAAA